MARAPRAADDADWAFHADDAAVLGALVNGRHAASLRVYFGSAAYAELAPLARAAAAARRAGGARVLVLPGIMGSRLGGAPRPQRGSGVIWVDPLCIAAGGLLDLALPAGRDIGPRGVLLYAYAQLLLKLRLHGFDADFHPYDWRLGLDELGAALAARIAAEPRPVLLIGHSMGGLVARMALALLPRRRVRKLILLGTPNFGSFAPVQALRGTYPFVRTMARLDLEHTAEYLAAHVFATFPGLCQLLPAGGPRLGTNLCRPARWPTTGPRPDPRLLAAAAAMRAKLAPPDARMLQIAGVNRETVVNARRRGAGFDYELGLRGDGTVPLASALLPGLRSWYVEEWHALLPNNGAVIQAIIELLRHGRTRALPQRWRAPRAAPRRVDDAALRRQRGPKIDWRRLDMAAREATLAELND